MMIMAVMVTVMVTVMMAMISESSESSESESFLHKLFFLSDPFQDHYPGAIRLTFAN